MPCRLVACTVIVPGKLSTGGVLSTTGDEYSSAEARKELALSMPPATSTWPSCSKVAVCSFRESVMLPVTDHVPVDGSYNSAETEPLPVLSIPPATRTLPLLSNVAVWQ